MYELTNEQRKCFGLQSVKSDWIRLELKPSPGDDHKTLAYVDGTVIRKCVQSGEKLYQEYELCELLSEDLRYILPKTAKGKPVLLSAATLVKRTGIGMCLSYAQRSADASAYIDLYSHKSQKRYYASGHEKLPIYSIREFVVWVENWYKETTPEDLEAVARFAEQPRQHIKFSEGDVFRFRLNRRLYGYGRILLDYDQMRKRKEPFWDVLMCKPLACSVYHIITERKDVTVEELRNLKSLPSEHIMDNRLYYGDYQIIGNIPIGEREDYPILYGASKHIREQATMLQCGKVYRRLDNVPALLSNLRTGSVSFALRVQLPVLQQCIAEGSNGPYWSQNYWIAQEDLRNPKRRKELEAVCRQFGISVKQLCKPE